MAKSCSTLITLFFFFTLSLASHAPLDNDEASATQAALVNPNEQVNSEKRFNTFVIPSAALTKVPFRAINRRFPVRSKLPCHHRHKVRPTVTNYDNDVVFPTGENSDFEAPVVVYGGGGRRVSGRWLRLRHLHPRPLPHQNHVDDRESDEGRIKKAVAYKRHVYDRFDQEEELKGLKKMKQHFRFQNGEGVMKKKMKKGGFMRSLRKFLDQYT